MTVASATVDQAIANPNVPNPIGTMGNMVNLARGIQGYQAGAMELQAQQQSNQDRMAVVQAIQNKDPALMPGPDGIINQAAATARLQQLAPQDWGKYLQNVSASNSNNTSINDALIGLDKNTRDSLASVAGAGVKQPVSMTVAGIQDWMETNAKGGNAAKVNFLGNKLLDSLGATGGDQDKVDSVLQFAGLRTKAIGDIVSARQPQASIVSTGQEAVPTVTQSNWSGLPVGKTFQGQQLQPPPGTSIYNPKTQQTELLGATGNKTGAGGGVPTSPPIGTEQSIQGSVGEMNRHYASLNDQSTGSQLVSSLSGNIQSLAQKAITGTEQDKKAYVNGMLNALNLGNKATGDLQKDTDLLEKNLAQLNLSTPASTDAVRNLVSIARPHTTMIGTAIPEATQQVVSQVKANMALRNYLTPYRMANGGAGDVVGYQHAREQGENTFDPRIWQYEEMKKANPAAAKQFIGGQPDASDLVKKAQQLVSMGVLQ